MTTDNRHTDAKHPQGANRPNDPTNATMSNVSHTNPHTNESMGSLFEHGVTIVADGGARGAVDDGETDTEGETTDSDADEATEEEPPESTRQMRNVSHEAPEGGHGNRMFERVGKAEDVPDDAGGDEVDEDQVDEDEADDETAAEAGEATGDETAAENPVEAADE